jgi:hypothetical protein
MGCGIGMSVLKPSLLRLRVLLPWDRALLLSIFLTDHCVLVHTRLRELMESADSFVSPHRNSCEAVAVMLFELYSIEYRILDMCRRP